MSKDLRKIQKNYTKLTPLERFKLSARAIERHDYDDLQWLRDTRPMTTYLGPEAGFQKRWEALRRVLSLAYPTWVENQKALEILAQALHFVEMTNEQARDHAGDYYCQGYTAAWRDAGRSEDELQHTHHCINDCDACADRCDEPAEEGMYTFSGLEKRDPFIYGPAMDELSDQFVAHLVDIKALYIALGRLCEAQGITLTELLAGYVPFQYAIKKSREFLAAEIGESLRAHVEQMADVHFAMLNAFWNNDTDYKFIETVEAVCGPEVARMLLELLQSVDLSDWDVM